ncbi:MAG: YhbY family RNA-binding protein [Opitutales bacterium]|nr:YhbY family RNA-binding protein [Opitutales bacterium]
MSDDLPEPTAPSTPSDLTGKARSRLRGLGMALKPAVLIGKAGVSAPVIAETTALFERHTLLKIRLTSNDRKERAHQAQALAEAVGAEVVGTSGKTALLHRLPPGSTKTNPPDQEITDDEP